MLTAFAKRMIREEVEEVVVEVVDGVVSHQTATVEGKKANADVPPYQGPRKLHS